MWKLLLFIAHLAHWTLTILLDGGSWLIWAREEVTFAGAPKLPPENKKINKIPTSPARIECGLSRFGSWGIAESPTLTHQECVCGAVDAETLLTVHREFSDFSHCSLLVW
uniref:Putative secreted protein n=1 Tax=Lutzomyia longipalpis TaxID=7200 RepID=A0A1B0CVC8_LUTLO